MPNGDDVIVERPESDVDVLKQRVEGWINDALVLTAEELPAEDEAQLGQAAALGPFVWDVLAWGPWQTVPISPSDPGRIIFVGETAYIATAVFLSPGMATNLGGLGARIQLNYFTSNMQTMTVVPGLTRSVCIDVLASQTVYVDVWRLTPTQAACLYETNICALICNCNHQIVPDYAAFVRYVYDFDRDTIVPGAAQTPGFGFDRPIRYLVADRSGACC